MCDNYRRIAILSVASKILSICIYCRSWCLEGRGCVGGCLKGRGCVGGCLEEIFWVGVTSKKRTTVYFYVVVACLTLVRIITMNTYYTTKIFSTESEKLVALLDSVKPGEIILSLVHDEAQTGYLSLSLFIHLFLHELSINTTTDSTRTPEPRCRRLAPPFSRSLSSETCGRSSADLPSVVSRPTRMFVFLFVLMSSYIFLVYNMNKSRLW